MKKEISKGTQKFIWHMAAFIAVFVLALVAINKFAPAPASTSVQNGITESQSAQQETLPQGDDFDSVKERVDAANNSTGREVKSLYEGEQTAMQKQASSRLFFSNLKNLLFCVLLVVLIVLLIKKGFDFKKLKKMITDGDEEQPEKEKHAKPEKETPAKPETPEPIAENPPEPVPSGDSSDEEEPPLEEEPGFDEGAPSEDEQEVAENCTF